MTDRELLELAAKAAGFSNFKFDENEWFYIDSAGYGDWELWNPLTNDGDALRLAVALGLLVYGRDIGCAVNDWLFVDTADCGGDPCAAARRAIVLEAADIGQSAAAPSQSPKASE